MLRHTMPGLVCCLSLAAAGGDPATYTQGTVKGLPLQAQGRIELDGQNLIFHHGANHLMVPYQNIKAVDVDVPGGGKEPAYKIWKLHKRLGSDSALRRVTVRFAAEPDVVKMMVFAMAPEHAAHVQRSLQAATAKTFDQKPELGEVKSVYREEWWGDSMWKTTRNAAKWPDNRPAGGTGNER